MGEVGLPLAELFSPDELDEYGLDANALLTREEFDDAVSTPLVLPQTNGEDALTVPGKYVFFDEPLTMAPVLVRMREEEEFEKRAREAVALTRHGLERSKIMAARIAYSAKVLIFRQPYQYPVHRILDHYVKIGLSPQLIWMFVKYVDPTGAEMARERIGQVLRGK